jgi:glycosyltransferase involved in cell wall biosynthesis
MMGQKILFLDALPFDSRIQVGSHHYARLFSKAGHEVFSLSNYLHFFRFLRRRPEDREMIRGYFAGVRAGREGILHYTPFCVLPYLKFPGLDSVLLGRNCLRFCWPRLKGKLGPFREVDILFINNIRLLSILKIVRAGQVVLRITDRFSAFPNVPSSIGRLEDEALRLADVAFATSRSLQQDSIRINPNSHYLPNGVEAAFIKRTGQEEERPVEYKDLNGPIALYVGAVSDWFDYDTFEYGLAQLPEVSFVVIGPVGGYQYKRNRDVIHRFSASYPNFRFLGPRPSGGLKPYLSHADVGLIPFQLNPLSHDINPVKMFEYAAWGLPTVASNMREIGNFRRMVFLYTGREEYVDLLQRAIEEKGARASDLIAVAQDNTWEKRFEFLVSKLAKAGR